MQAARPFFMLLQAPSTSDAIAWATQDRGIDQADTDHGPGKLEICPRVMA